MIQHQCDNCGRPITVDQARGQYTGIIGDESHFEVEVTIHHYITDENPSDNAAELCPACICQIMTTGVIGGEE